MRRSQIARIGVVFDFKPDLATAVVSEDLALSAAFEQERCSVLGRGAEWINPDGTPCRLALVRYNSVSGEPQIMQARMLAVLKRNIERVATHDHPQSLLPNESPSVGPRKLPATS